uniref:Na+/H+ antiporter subunit C n=1 Tax=Fervidicoccus fontis TaxID=683846 RepID=A0A7C1E915_9CREN
MNNELLNNVLLTYVFYVLVATIGISLYGVIFKPHLTKKIISITIFSDSINLLAIFIGYKLYSIPPELKGMSNINEVLNRTVDPFPQALVLTAIVIGLAVTLFLIFISLQLFRLHGTLDLRKIKELRE